jgi:23S rRNA (guanosine2251-2'-O)-methyltransferase
VLELCILGELAQTGQTRELERQAKASGASVRRVPRRELDRICGSGDHQGLAVKVPGEGSEGEGASLDALAELPESEKASALLVALDQVQDPHNLGAIARSAACLGARALLLPERRSAPVTQAALSASAGALQKIPVVHVVNLAQGLARLKEAGYWIYGADMGGTPAWKARLNRPMVLVVGSEGQGLRPVVRQQCDEIVSIPQSEGGVDSLNASCAASVLLYEAARQAAS